MGRNDYLLTVALLSVYVVGYGDSENWDITTLGFNQYSLRDCTEQDKGDSTGTGSALYLGDTKVGYWQYEYDDDIEERMLSFGSTESTERAIFTALGLERA
jgi:hypothetical protein